MPEGDTIFMAAARLRGALVGRPITSFVAKTLRPQLDLKGRAVESVEARGKNLLIHFEGRLVLYTHMRMSGSWHVYRPGEPWRKAASRARVTIENGVFTVVCFNAPVVELMTEARAQRHPVLSQLGPDLLAETPDFPTMLRKLRHRPDRPLGEALMDQRTLAGIGNVYKSEVCFLERLDPFSKTGAHEEAALLAVLRRARLLMRSNLVPVPRSTRQRGRAGRYWVYGRGGEPCLECRTPIRVRRQGDAGRTTYFCPSCQES